jgi:hypothetical protein
MSLPGTIAVAAASTGAPASGSTGTISGTVSNSSKTGLSGICVFAEEGSPYNEASTPAITGAGGTYTLTALQPGSYYIEFTTFDPMDGSGCGTAGDYVNQWYSGDAEPGSATTETVAAGSAISGVNAQMVEGGQIAGTVTNGSGTGLTGVCISASSSDGNFYFDSFAVTGAGGTYSLADLGADTYTVSFDTDCGNTGNYAPTTYDNGAVITIAAGSDLQNINGVMGVGAIVTGTVTNASDSPVAGICASATNPTTGAGNTSITAANGSYSIESLASGSYTVESRAGAAARRPMPPSTT